MSREPGWEDFEPTTAEEVVGLALIAAGFSGPVPEGYTGSGETMDRQTASEITAALREAGYLSTEDNGPPRLIWQRIDAISSMDDEP